MTCGVSGGTSAFSQVVLPVFRAPEAERSRVIRVATAAVNLR